MKIEKLDISRVGEFIDYCKKHRREVDESFLEDGELDEFVPNEENPSYILLNDNNQIIGAVSLVIDEYFIRGKKGRFRIFHAEDQNVELYSMLLKAILPYTSLINRVFLFVQEDKKEFQEIFKALGFDIERYAYLLERINTDIPMPDYPLGYEIQPFRLNEDEETWCDIRNSAFKNLAGGETPLTPSMVAELTEEYDYVEGGMLILYDNGKPAGLIRIAKDFDEGVECAYIGPLALKPEYQGKGLGRTLLREGLLFGRDKGFEKTILSVNAENERAVELYLKEGFTKAQVMICYNLNLK